MSNLVLRAAVLLGCAGVLACSSTTTTTTTEPVDSGVTPDTNKPDTRRDAADTAQPDTRPPDCRPQPSGTRCGDDLTCDPCESGLARCHFDAGSLNPSPICYSTGCDPGDGTRIVGCDGDTGVCLGSGASTICLAVCEFDDSIAAPKGCEGKNRCNLYGWGRDTGTMKTIGVGYCLGGCRADADCPTGNRCQVEDGMCVTSLVAYAKALGEACTEADAKAPAQCNCLYAGAERAGYCVTACYAPSDCAAGFTCDPGLPKTKVRDDDVVFTAAPAGLAGYCLKNCDVDADCAGLNAYCSENAGTGRKTCQVGRRPCVRNDQCPSPQTCMGATATALGRCG